jgi:hypothetical protein
MPELYIDRLTLKLNGGDARSAHRLAQEVSGALADLPLTGNLPAETALVRVSVRSTGTNNRSLAHSIAAGIHSGLRRS